MTAHADQGYLPIGLACPRSNLPGPLFPRDDLQIPNTCPNGQGQSLRRQAPRVCVIHAKLLFPASSPLIHISRQVPAQDLAQPIHDHCTARPCRPIDGLDANAQVKVRDLVKIVVD
jgi:hypothetical protein